MKDPAVFLVAFSTFDDRNNALKVNRASCAPQARASLAALLALGLLFGCSQPPGAPAEKSAQPPVKSAAEQKEAAPAPAPAQPSATPPTVDESAKTPEPKATGSPTETPQALQDLEKKIRPNIPPPPPPSAADDEAERARASVEVARWAEKIGAHDPAGAAEFLITEKDLEEIVTDGIRKILSSSLLSKNRKDLDAILEEAKGKDVRLTKWTPENIARTQPGSFYRKSMTSLKGSLELTIGNQPTSLALDLLLVGGRWKLFKLTRPD